ncbi:flagellar hook assembly protein FlgD [Polaromonas sp. A23]|uniref:flagellar hook assembly protein FlgD n=1 Tax=Polaromonas sp. A23 TaxID=1944133 RepID=UPI00098751AC|nr:flagellar hook capping FlgD N-terminal domain-containing protein [Polaromonas sp. A23]OOG44437.1 flagellar hook capping protein [Polaromonas sp. A23]
MTVALLGSSASQAPSTALQSSSINQEDFLKLLLTQLKFQDPLKPVDNTAFLAQLAQFSSLAQTKALDDKIGQLLSIQSATQSIGLLGKTVEVTTSTGNVVGQVTTLSLPDGVPSLTVTDSTGAVLTGISLSQITVVR